MRRYINFRTWPHSIRSWLPSYGCPTSWATEPVVWKCWSFCVGLTFNFCWSNDDSGESSLKHLRLQVLTSENFQQVGGVNQIFGTSWILCKKDYPKLAFRSYNFFWQIFDENIFHWIFGQFLTSTSGGYFLFLPNVERVVGWLGREWIIVGWRSPQNYSLGNQYNVDPHIMSILLLFNIYQVTTD